MADYLDALDHLGISGEMSHLLRTPEREVTFELPLRRDDGRKRRLAPCPPCAALQVCHNLQRTENR